MNDDKECFKAGLFIGLFIGFVIGIGLSILIIII